jgi:hypothetical protein
MSGTKDNEGAGEVPGQKTRNLNEAIEKDLEYEQPTPAIPSEQDAEVDEPALPHNEDHPVDTTGEEAPRRPISKREQAIERRVAASKRHRGLQPSDEGDDTPAAHHMDEMLDQFPEFGKDGAQEQEGDDASQGEGGAKEDRSQRDISEAPGTSQPSDADPLVPVNVDGEVAYKKWSEVRTLVEVPVAIDKRQQELGALNERIGRAREELDRTVTDPDGNERAVREAPDGGRAPKTMENPTGADLDEFATVEEIEEMLIAEPARSREILNTILKRNRSEIDPATITDMVNAEIDRRGREEEGRRQLSSWRNDYKDVLVDENGNDHPLAETVYGNARRKMVEELRRMNMPEDWLEAHKNDNVAILREYSHNLGRPEIVEYYKPKAPLDILREAGEATRALVSSRGNGQRPGDKNLDLTTRRERARAAEPVPQRNQQRGADSLASPSQKVASIDQERKNALSEIRKRRPGTRSRRP